MVGFRCEFGVNVRASDGRQGRREGLGYMKYGLYLYGKRVGEGCGDRRARCATGEVVQATHS